MKEIDKKPVISVYMTTYYHEKYVEQAIESVLKQKISVPIEIVISDDHSNDRTVEILRKYERKYPFIKVNYNKENIGLSRNMFFVKTICSGDYIVDLSGDDFYITDTKLQEQYDFLENNKDFFAVCVKVVQYNEDGSKRKIDPRTKGVFLLEDFLYGNNISLNGIMMRNVLKERDGYEWFSLMPKMSNYIDDITDSFLILLYGKVYILDSYSVAYRYVNDLNSNNFNSRNSGIISFKRSVELLNNIDTYFKGNYSFTNRYRNEVAKAIKMFFTGSNILEIIKVYKLIPCKYRQDLLILRSIAYGFNKIYNKSKLIEFLTK